MDAETKRVMLFDGVCNFCNDAVLFVLDRDLKQNFAFASQQSDFGQQMMRAHALTDPNFDGLVLVEGDRAYTCSSAVLRVAKSLRWPWPLAYYLLIWVPRFVRDPAYRYFAKHRYAWFGKSESCRIPTPELRRRMLA